MADLKATKSPEALRITLTDGSTVVSGHVSVEKILRLTLFRGDGSESAGAREPTRPTPPSPQRRAA